MNTELLIDTVLCVVLNILQAMLMPFNIVYIQPCGLLIERHYHNIIRSRIINIHTTAYS